MVFFVIIVAVIACVAIHYEFLHQLTLMMPRLKIHHRARIVLGVIGALVAHTVEICLFGVAYHVLIGHEVGELLGAHTGTLADSIYYSFTTYTTLGFGDIEPRGDIRFLTGIESVVGLVLITWTASFLYLEMQKYWRLND